MTDKKCIQIWGPYYNKKRTQKVWWVYPKWPDHIKTRKEADKYFKKHKATVYSEEEVLETVKRMMEAERNGDN